MISMKNATIPQQGWNQQTPAVQSMLYGGQRVVRRARKAGKAARKAVRRGAKKAAKKAAASKAARFVKGSAAAKRHMARLRNMRK